MMQHKFLGKGSSFVDFKYVKVCAGNGGDGCIAFFRGIQLPMGPPSGGNGGRGGSVYVRASKDVTSLNGVPNQCAAPNGNQGRGKQMHGADGEDIEIVVPVGTIVREVVMPATTPSKQQLLREAQEEELAKYQELAKEERRRRGEARRGGEAAASTTAESDAAPRAGSDPALDGASAADATDMSTEDGSEVDNEFDEDSDLEMDEWDAAELAKRQEAEEIAREEAYERRMEILSQHFKFRDKYAPQEDRMRMLFERIPRDSAKSSAPMLEFELLEDGERRLVARGGRGGLGNPHFVTPVIPGPGIAGRGEKATPIVLQLELKTMADAGLVGLPNAGKSTLLKATSNAHPKIAPYPFTTLNPYVGTIDFDDYWTMTIADIPGIIAGAHANLGLGHQFLRHIERTKLLVYVIDLAGEAPWDDLATLQSELEAFKEGMTNRPSLIAANKADVAALAKQNFEILKSRTSIPIVPISAKNEKNIRTLTNVMRKLVENINAEEERAKADKAAEARKSKAAADAAAAAKRIAKAAEQAAKAAAREAARPGNVPPAA
nr:GTPase of the mitochondrial inner membrane that associates with the large ribosomal subunit [Polyrhizophydium stewartii]